ncbi:MAG: hypothetical protein V4808_14365 [Pseudomonadota bacterium]
MFAAPSAAAADDVRGLTECRREYFTMAVFEKLPGLKVIEAPAGSDRYSVDASTLQPFGLPMLNYFLYTRTDDKLTVMVLNGDVNRSFEAARDAMLAGHRASACTRTTPAIGSRRCILDLNEPESPEMQQNVEVREYRGTVVLECVGKVPAPKP